HRADGAAPRRIDGARLVRQPPCGAAGQHHLVHDDPAHRRRRRDAPLPAPAPAGPALPRLLPQGCGALRHHALAADEVHAAAQVPGQDRPEASGDLPVSHGHDHGPTADVSVRVAWADDADAIAGVQVRAWPELYADLLPAEVLPTDPAALAETWRAAMTRPADARNRVLVALERSTVPGP